MKWVASSIPNPLFDPWDGKPWKLVNSVLIDQRNLKVMDTCAFFHLNTYAYHGSPYLLYDISSNTWHYPQTIHGGKYSTRTMKTTSWEAIDDEAELPDKLLAIAMLLKE